jgi:urease accessory protein
VPIRADRRNLARRIWRGAAEDGTEFGFELDAPLLHGDVVGETAFVRYVIRQEPEPILEIPLDVAPDAAAVIGWAVGNLHAPVESRPTRLLAPDDPGLRQTLDRMGIPYREARGVFQPIRTPGSPAVHGLTLGHAH